MKSRKLLALILALCLIFSLAGCDIIVNVFENETTEDSLVNNTPEDGAGDDNDTTGGDNNNGGNTDTDSGDTNNGGNGNNNNNGTSGGDGSKLPSSINVIMINDNHGMLNEESGSLDKIASGISYYESLGDVVKIANGDMFQGTYVSSTLRGLPMLEALNELDFDAFVIGNHEFDWGFDEIKKYKDGDPSNGEADFPFLGANIYDKRTGEMVDWLEPYTIVEVNGIKIGIIGVIGELESSIMASHVADYDFVEPTQIIKDLAFELRAEKECDVVLVATHSDNKSLNTELASDTSAGVDGVFSAHSHNPTDYEIPKSNGIDMCVLQNGGYGESFAVLTLFFDEEGYLTDTDGKLEYTYNYTSTGILSTVFEKYDEYMSIGDTVLFTTDEYVSKYNVGLTVARSMYVKYGVDFAVINSGGVRSAIDAGEVTYAEVFQVLPFENEVYIVTLSGALLKSYINNAGGIYYWGINVSTIVDSEYYSLAIVDYVYLGSYFENYRNDTYIDTNDLIRDVLIELLLLESL